MKYIYGKKSSPSLTSLPWIQHSFFLLFRNEEQSSVQQLLADVRAHNSYVCSLVRQVFCPICTNEGKFQLLRKGKIMLLFVFILYSETPVNRNISVGTVNWANVIREVQDKISMVTHNYLVSSHVSKISVTVNLKRHIYAFKGFG